MKESDVYLGTFGVKSWLDDLSLSFQSRPFTAPNFAKGFCYIRIEDSNEYRKFILHT